jgi:hypothetical protein
MGLMIIPTFQMRKLRHREVKKLAEHCPAGKGKILDLNANSGLQRFGS